MPIARRQLRRRVRSVQTSGGQHTPEIDVFAGMFLFSRMLHSNQPGARDECLTSDRRTETRHQPGVVFLRTHRIAGTEYMYVQEARDLLQYTESAPMPEGQKNLWVCRMTVLGIPWQFGALDTPCLRRR